MWECFQWKRSTRRGVSERNVTSVKWCSNAGPPSVTLVWFSSKQTWAIALHYTALHCAALLYVALHCNAMQCIACHCITLLWMQCNAMQSNTMQCNAMQCNAMQCNAMQCNAMQCNAMQCNGIALHCIALHCNEKHCNVLLTKDRFIYSFSQSFIHLFIWKAGQSVPEYLYEWEPLDGLWWKCGDSALLPSRQKKTLKQYWFNVGPPSTTLAQH